jgi:predicted AAA+ superfamily ATPase
MIQSQLSSTLFPLTVQALLVRYAAIYPTVVINGPRQSGKTTLAPLFPNAHQWIVYGAPQRGVLGDTKLLSLETLDALDDGI